MSDYEDTELLILADDAVPLTDDYAVVMTVNGQGGMEPLLLHRSWIDGNYRVPGVYVAHEQLGPLPAIEQRIIDKLCGARRKDGKPCRTWGGCRWHRKAVS